MLKTSCQYVAADGVMRARVERVGETQIIFELFGMWQENNIKGTEIVFRKGENDQFNV